MNVLSRFLWVRNPNPWLRWMLLACFLSKPVVKTCCLGLQQGSVEEDPLPSSPKSLLAGSHWPETWVPCPMAPLSIWAPHDMVCFPRLRAPRRREQRGQPRQALSFWIPSPLGWDILSLLLYVVVRCESRGLVYTHGEGLPQGYDSRGGDHWQAGGRVRQGCSHSTRELVTSIVAGTCVMLGEGRVCI